MAVPTLGVGTAPSPPEQGIFGIRSGDWGGACGLRVAPHAPHPWGDAPARGVGCATFSRASATRTALAEKKKSERWRRGQVQIRFTTMMILLAIIPLSTYTDLAIPFSAVDRSRFCPRGIARRPGCASGPFRRRRRENRCSIAHGREPLRTWRDRRLLPRGSKRDARTCRQQRDLALASAHFQEVVLEARWFEGRTYLGGRRVFGKKFQ